VVRRLLRLMRFYNAYPAFSGKLTIEDAPDDELKLTWKKAPYETQAHIDLNTYRTTIRFVDPKHGKMSSFTA
jgi:hypothetical protein